MNKMQEQVREFHEKFGVLIGTSPAMPDEATKRLRYELVKEEAIELFVALDKDDLIGTADALADLLYVVFGTAVSFGIDIEKVFNEVHRSNMTKVWPDGTVHYSESGKVVKPPSYSPANIGETLR